MATLKLSDICKTGNAAPLSSDIIIGGLAIDLTNKKAYSRDKRGDIFNIVPPHPTVNGADSIAPRTNFALQSIALDTYGHTTSATSASFMHYNTGGHAMVKNSNAPIERLTMDTKGHVTGIETRFKRVLYSQYKYVEETRFSFDGKKEYILKATAPAGYKFVDIMLAGSSTEHNNSVYWVRITGINKAGTEVTLTTKVPYGIVWGKA